MRPFTEFLERIVKLPTGSNLERFVNHVLTNRVSDGDLASLATALAQSGKVRARPSRAETADLASTGGPSSLTTLLSPLYLRSFGYCVPKLGVAGRPAGGIDVMAQLPGFKVCLAPPTLERVLAKTGYAHFLADETFTPLDAKLFEFRQKHQAQAVSEFVLTSILAKKIAVGVKRVGLDVRVAPHGNFGETWSEARKNAKRFCRVAQLLGIEAVGILTDARFPYQPYIGRTEALEALADIFEDCACPWLRRHDDLCFAIAALTASRRCEIRPSTKELKALFGQHLQGQGSSLASFDQVVRKSRKQARIPIISKQEGFLHIKLDLLRDALTAVQNQYSTHRNRFPDPCGVVLAAMPGDYIWPGSVVGRLRALPSSARRLLKDVQGAFSVVKDAMSPPIIEEVRYV